MSKSTVTPGVGSNREDEQGCSGAANSSNSRSKSMDPSRAVEIGAARSRSSERSSTHKEGRRTSQRGEELPRSAKENRQIAELLSSTASLPKCPEDEARLFSHPASSPIGALISGILMSHASEDPLIHPMIIARRMGLKELTLASLRQAGKAAIAEAISSPKPLCSRPKWCSLLIWKALDHIESIYNGDPERVWNNGAGIKLSRLVRRLGRVPGIGSKAYDLADVFVRHWSLPILEWDTDDLEIDQAQMRVARRLGWYHGMPTKDISRLKLSTYRGLLYLSFLCCWERGPDCNSCSARSTCLSTEKIR